MYSKIKREDNVGRTKLFTALKINTFLCKEVKNPWGVQRLW